MDYSFYIGSCANDYETMLSVFTEHNKEIGIDGLEFSVDIDLYKAYESIGAFVPIFARTETGLNIGYIFYLLYPHPHYKGTVFASTDCFYIAPLYRGTNLFRNMVQYSEQALKAKGVQFTQFVFSSKRDLSALAKRYGYKELDTVYFKRISDV